jgi:hypothetical protein
MVPTLLPSTESSTWGMQGARASAVTWGIDAVWLRCAHIGRGVAPLPIPKAAVACEHEGWALARDWRAYRTTRQTLAELTTTLSIRLGSARSASATGQFRLRRGGRSCWVCGRPEGLLLNDHALRHILPNACGYARLIRQIDRNQGHGSLPAEIRDF